MKVHYEIVPRMPSCGRERQMTGLVEINNAVIWVQCRW